MNPTNIYQFFAVASILWALYGTLFLDYELAKTLIFVGTGWYLSILCELVRIQQQLKKATGNDLKG